MDGRVILYICADLDSYSSLRKLRKFTTCAAKRGFQVVAVWPGLFWQKPENAWKLDFFRMFSEQDFCAIVMEGEFYSEGDIYIRQAELASKRKIPFVILDIESPGVSSVRFDDEGALKEIIDHVLTKHECKNPIFVGDSTQKAFQKRYIKVFTEAMNEAGISGGEDRVYLCGYREGKGVMELGYLIKKINPDAVICSDNSIANMIAGIANTMGINVPEELIITGLNGINNRRSGAPDLTDTKRNFTLQADKCLEIIEGMLAESDGFMRIRNEVVKEEIHFSESCGCGYANEIANTSKFIRFLIVQREFAIAQERRQVTLAEDLSKANTKEEMAEAIRKILPAFTSFCVRARFADAMDGENTKAEIDEKETFRILASYDPSLEGQCFDSNFLRERALAQSRNIAPLILYPVYIKGEYYGFVFSEFPEFTEYQQMMGRLLICLCRSISNLVHRLTIKERNEEIRDMSEYLNNIRYRDQMTGMLNSKGLVMELEECKLDCIERKQNIHMICVDLDHLGNINDIYGHSEGDSAILTLSELIDSCVSRSDLTAHIGSDEFVVIIRSDESAAKSVEYFINRLRESVVAFNNNSHKEYTLNINTSSSMLIPYADTDMQKAVDEALLNKRITKNNKRGAAGAGEELSQEELAQEALIKEVLDKNRFRYAFQPIIEASTGRIFAYEALMRPDTDVSISPLTVIKYATMHRRLYDVERATFFNILKQVYENRDRFFGKKIFINSIPGYQIDQADYELLKKKYPGVLKDFFIEITEQSEQDDDEIRVLSERSVADEFGIAIDDYGVGYANTASLLRYTPNCVKIDRLLIQNLQDDPRKQHFVKNIIEFAHDNKFMALAEGVETAEEMKASIALGVDLIQGFYVARPDYTAIEELPTKLVDDILEMNRKEEKHYSKLFVVSREKEIMMMRLGLELYTDILVSGQTVTFVGNPNYPTAIKFRIKDNSDSTVILKNVVLENEEGSVGIEIGENATLTLVLEGDNYINSNGILVPPTSTLKIQGSGDLHIKSKCKAAFGIGNDLMHSFGTIITDMSGVLDINLNGEKAVGIGGCVPGQGTKIILKGADNKIQANATAFVGIGAFSGRVDINISELHFLIDFNVVNGVGIGTPSGSYSLTRLSNCFVEIKGGGKSITGIGCATNAENNRIEVISAKLAIDMNSPRAVMVGCPVGRVKFYSELSRIDLSGSGGKVMAIGSANFGGEIILKSVGFGIKISSDNPIAIGAREENCDFGSSFPEIEIINYSANYKDEGSNVMNPEIIGPLPKGAELPPGAIAMPEGFGPPPGVTGPPEKKAPKARGAKVKKEASETLKEAAKVKKETAKVLKEAAKEKGTKGKGTKEKAPAEKQKTASGAAKTAKKQADKEKADNSENG